MKYHYDNSARNPLNPSSPPKEVRGGNHAKDEMSHFWLQVVPADDADQRAVLQEAIMHRRLEKYPGDFSANFNLGDLMMNQNNPGAAVPYFRLATAADPGSAIAAGELGAALFSTDSVYEAEQQYQRALTLDPHYIDARYNLASIEAQNQQWAASAGDFTEILKVNPNHQKARQHLGEVYFMWADQLEEAGDHEQAIKRYQDAGVIRPEDPELHAHLGATLAELKRFKEAKAEFESVLKIDPNSQEAKQALVAIDARQRLTSQ